MSYLVRLKFFLKYSRFFVIDRLFYIGFIVVDMYCLLNVILIVGGGEFGYINGYGKKVRFENLFGVVVRDEKFFVCD